jgi:hypothetical protein
MTKKTGSTDDGIETDHWNDSEEDLFGSLKRGKLYRNP